MKNKKPIGVFDSGYGGLTVLKEIVKRLPQYDYLYLGDNARAPYGSRSFDTVFDYTLQAVQYLFEEQCELVILACNTASAKALRTIQQKYLPQHAPEKRVLGVIRPTAEVIGDYTRSAHVGVFGTQGTVSSLSYPVEIGKLHPGVTVTQEACPMWVPIVENNEIDNSGSLYFIQKHVDQLLKQDPEIDTVILGCTHYPLLSEKIKSVMPGNITLLSQGEIVSDKLCDYLRRHPEIESKCTKGGQISFITTENPEDFDRNATRFFGQPVFSSRVVL